MNPFLIFILFALIATFLIETILNILNIKNLSPTVPEEFRAAIEEDTYKKSQNYLKENSYHQLFSSAFNTALVIGFILIGGFEYVDRIARSFHLSTLSTALIFAGIPVIGFIVLQIPFNAYHTFIIEERYGFNRTTAPTFFLDIVKSLFLILLIGAPTFTAIVWFFETFENPAWVLCWGALTLLQLALTYIAPVTIFRLFNKYTPLEEGLLKSSIEEYAQTQNFSFQGIFVMDESRRSSKTNAFFTGWGRWKRIVLYDTLIQKHSIDEIIAIIAHEIGHCKKRHMIKIIGLATLNTGIKLYLLAWLINYPPLFKAFQMTHLSVYASLFFFAVLYSPIEMVLSIGFNILSRRYEYQADRFAATTCSNRQALIDALKKIAVENLSNLTPHPWKVAVSYSHPPVLQRIRKLAILQA